MLVDITLQRRDITAVTIAEDYTASGKGGVGEFIHGCLLDIERHLHFQKVDYPFHPKDNATKALVFFVSQPRFSLLLSRQSMHHQIRWHHTVDGFRSVAP